MGNFFELVLFKTKADLIAEASKTYLSFLWWIIDPLFIMCVYYIVFGLLLRFGSDNFIAILLIGIVSWQWFSRTVTNCAGSILGSGRIIDKIRINKLFFPLVVICTDLVKTGLVFILLLIVIHIIGYPMGSAYPLLILVFLVQLLFIASISFWVALIVPFFPDLAILLNSLLIGLMFMSGVFYTPDRIPEALLGYFYLNPIAYLITAYRDIIINNAVPNMLQLAAIACLSTILIALGHWFSKIHDNTYIRLVIH